MSFKDKLIRAGVVSAGDVDSAKRRVEDERAEAERRRLAGVKEQGAARHVRAAPRYPGAAPASLARARELLAEHLARLAPPDGGDDGGPRVDVDALLWPSVQLVDGDLAVEELALEPDGSALYVRGDLAVERVVHQRADAGALVVLGSLRARHVVAMGAVVCVGDLEVPGVLYGGARGGAVHVLGRAAVGTLVGANGHRVALRGAHAVGRIVAVGDGAEGLARYGAVGSPSGVIPEAGDLTDDAAVAEALRTRGALFAP